MLEVKAYRDTWGQDGERFIPWLFDTFVLLAELLAPGAAIVVHMGWRRSHLVKAVADEVFGADNFVNQIVWKRQAAHSDIGQGARHLGPIHDVMLLYRNGPDLKTWSMQYEPYDQSYLDNFYKYADEGTGRRFRLSDITGPEGAAKGSPIYEVMGITRAWRYSRRRMDELIAQGRIVQLRPGTVPGYKRYADEMPGRPIQDMWTDISWVQRPTYATEKPEKLLERVIRLATNAGELVLDCFVGSGTTAVVSEKLGRRWIAADLGRFAVHTTRKRLLAIPGVKPFVVQNLGKYERQVWQTAEFGEGAEERQHSYRSFILELYHATPAGSWLALHGQKSGRWVHVGSVDSPVTMADLTAIANDVRAAGGGAVDVLGWDFAFETNQNGRDMLARAGIKADFKMIPKDVMDRRAVEQGDIFFFELGALGVDTAVEGNRLTVRLTDLIVRQDDIPADVRGCITHWSQMLDYWAVDWEYKGDTFHNQWQSYRTRKDPKIELSASREYAEPGPYRVMESDRHPRQRHIAHSRCDHLRRPEASDGAGEADTGWAFSTIVRRHRQRPPYRSLRARHSLRGRAMARLGRLSGRDRHDAHAASPLVPHRPPVARPPAVPVVRRAAAGHGDARLPA
jgi:hypothetical protein